MSLALEFYRSVPRYLASRAVADRFPGMIAGPVAPLRLVHRDEPPLPGPQWARVRTLISGICGSDLNTVSGASSFYFSPLVSMPFVPGHEVVGELLDDVPGFSRGQRVVIDPILSCVPRGIAEICNECANDRPNLCERIAGGDVDAGLQTGFCGSTGGGWSEHLIAHASQLHALTDDVADEGAVLVEPLACALHAVERSSALEGASVLVVGAGTVGLLTLVALASACDAAKVTMVAKYGHQAELARSLGAASVVHPSDAIGSVRRATRAFRMDPERDGPFLLGGVDVAFDCVGTKSSLDLCLRSTRARGRVILSGMPQGADLSPAWFRELELAGSYSGSGKFAAAIDLVRDTGLGKLVSASYPLSRWREALDHALQAGSLGAVKICFDPRLDE